MRIVNAVTGELVVDAPDACGAGDAAEAAADALGVHVGLVKPIITECAVVVLSGKVLCNQCSVSVICSCGAASCDCEVLENCDYVVCMKCCESNAEVQREVEGCDGHWTDCR